MIVTGMSWLPVLITFPSVVGGKHLSQPALAILATASAVHFNIGWSFSSLSCDYTSYYRPIVSSVSLFPLSPMTSSSPPPCPSNSPSQNEEPKTLPFHQLYRCHYRRPNSRIYGTGYNKRIVNFLPTELSPRPLKPVRLELGVLVERSLSSCSQMGLHSHFVHFHSQVTPAPTAGRPNHSS